MNMKSALCALLAMAASASVQAADDPHASSDLGFVAELGLEMGGDEVATVSFTDGSSQGVDAGQGVTFALGGHYRPSGWDVDFAATVGYKFVSTAATNADIGIDRVVIQVLATYDPADAWWVAGGPVWHQGVKFDADGFGRNIDLGDATGFTIQAGWKWIGLTYTSMEYTEQTTGRGVKLDANAIGLVLRWRG